MKKLLLSAVIVAGSIVSIAQTNTTKQTPVPVKRNITSPSLRQSQEGKTTPQPALRMASPVKSSAPATKASMPTQKAK